MLQGLLGAEFDGLKLKTVEPQGLLGAAAVQAGDTLKSVKGQKIEHLVDLFRIGRDAGDAGVELVFDRAGQEVKTKVSLRNLRGRRGRRGGEAAPAPTPPVKAEEAEGGARQQAEKQQAEKKEAEKKDAEKKEPVRVIR